MKTKSFLSFNELFRYTLKKDSFMVEELPTGFKAIFDYNYNLKKSTFPERALRVLNRQLREDRSNIDSYKDVVDGEKD